MPGRKHPLINDQIYHVFNKSIGKKILFDEKNSRYFLNLVEYYRSSNAYVRYSYFKNMAESVKEYYSQQLFVKESFRVSVLGYCLMPTHYHFILRQNQPNGISNFISLLQNSFTRYQNVKNNISGPSFLLPFKSKPVITEEQLKHLLRYLHLNPFSGNIVSSSHDLESYPWSSYNEYMYEPSICETDYILSLFGNKPKKLRDFTLNNMHHQKMLEICKHSEKWLS